MISYSRNIKASYIRRRVAIVALFFISLILPSYSWGLNPDPAFFDKYNFLNPLQLDNKYNLTGIGLNGSVYEIVGYSINPTYKFGEIVDENKKEIYRYIFDENGNLSERYGDYNHRGISRYISVSSLPHDPVGSVKHSMNDKEEVKPDDIYRVYNDSVIIESEYSATKEFYKRDEAGRITEVYICKYRYGNLENEQKIKISYNENGYSGEFWDTPTHKTVFTRTGNSFYYDPNTDWSFDKVTLALDNAGKVIEDNRQEYKYSYNKYGDLISATRSYPNTTKYGGTVIEIDEWEYVYDDKGNWIERKGHNTYKDTKVWERRDIKYLSPQQIQNLNDLKRSQEEERQRKIKEDFNANKKQKLENEFFEYIYFDFDEGPYSKLKKASYTRSFNVVNDVYNFTLSDNSEINNVKFTEKRGGWCLSPDKGVIMIPEYTQFGVDWYVLKYDPKVFERDWFKIDKERAKKFSEIEDAREKAEVYMSWLAREKMVTAREKASILEIGNSVNSEEAIHSAYHEYVIKDSNNFEEEVAFIINKIEEPYSNGFISPQISDKQKERETLDAAEINKKKRTIEMALSSREANKNKIKKFKHNKDGSYSFTLKDNRSFKNIQLSFFYTYSYFITGNDKVYINQEQNLVLIIPEYNRRSYIIDLETGYINYIDK